MTILKTDTVSGIGNTDGTVFEGDITFDSLNYITLPKGTTNQRVNSAGGRAVIPGGYNPAGSPNAAKSLNTIEYITIATLGNSQDFGDYTLHTAREGRGSNSIRAVFGGGTRAEPTISGVIDYITIATKGNATDFGDLSVSRRDTAGVASPVRVVFGGGKTPSVSDVMDYVSIATQGNAVDFGNLSEGRDHLAGCSNAHGGL